MRAALGLLVLLDVVGHARCEPIPLTEEQIAVRAKSRLERKKKNMQSMNRMKWEVKSKQEALKKAGEPITAEEVAEAEERKRRADLFTLTAHEAHEPRIELAQGEFKGATRMLYVDYTHRVAFCAIPKVACTEFIRLMCLAGAVRLLIAAPRPTDRPTDRPTALDGRDRPRRRYRLAGDKKWFTEPHFRSDAKVLMKLGKDEANAVLNDPNFTKFAFFRDPATRLLSAYLDKFVDSPGRGIHGNYGLRHFGRELDWPAFVDAIASNNTDRTKPEGLHMGTNAHWKPQYFNCAFEKFMPVYSFVGRYENLRDHAETFLRSAKLWDDFGSSGWAQRPRRERFYPKPDDPVPLRDEMFARSAKHHTNSESRKDKYFTPEILHKIRVAYAMDYDLFDAIGAHPDSPPVNGLAWRPTRKRLCDLGNKKDRRNFGDHCIRTCPNGRRLHDCDQPAGRTPQPPGRDKGP